ncbi:hypothetical protein SAY87_022841 [Trapa incisa]|uniref:Uncharacterized protein n=1 Tax=Trapa incisa TaxID=236973 RepID=A0AAN7Q9V2_9MYRT|nr:hypothetical protein SAY87_022841 [Trapa incisa]
MGRTGTDDDPTAAHHQSSIALLRERFKQLQREKEMREEKKLLMRMLNINNAIPTSPATYDQPSKFFYQPDYGSSPPQLSLSLRPNSESGDRVRFRATETAPMFVSSRSSSGNQFPRAGFSGKMAADDLDVDTSLHL